MLLDFSFLLLPQNPCSNHDQRSKNDRDEEVEPQPPGINPTVEISIKLEESGTEKRLICIRYYNLQLPRSTTYSGECSRKKQYSDGSNDSHDSAISRSRDCNAMRRLRETCAGGG